MNIGTYAVANAIGYAQHYSRSHGAVIRVYDASGNVIETHEQKGDFNEPEALRGLFAVIMFWRPMDCDAELGEKSS